MGTATQDGTGQKAGPTSTSSVVYLILFLCSPLFSHFSFLLSLQQAGQGDARQDQREGQQQREKDRGGGQWVRVLFFVLVSFTFIFS